MAILTLSNTQSANMSIPNHLMTQEEVMQYAEEHADTLTGVTLNADMTLYLHALSTSRFSFDTNCADTKTALFLSYYLHGHTYSTPTRFEMVHAITLYLEFTLHTRVCNWRDRTLLLLTEKRRLDLEHSLQTARLQQQRYSQQ